MAAQNRTPGRTWRIAVPVALAAGFFVNRLVPVGRWTEVRGLGLVFAAIVWLTAIAPARVRNGLLAVASAALCFIAFEAYCIVAYPGAIDIQTPGYRVGHAVIGWGPAHAGVFHHKKLDGGDGHVIYDVAYTIGDDLTRRVVSAPTGPTVAFFGDSMTFGIGIPDTETLPQSFADVTGRRLHVLNFAISGFGPQQYLRAIEAGLYDKLLTPAQAIVFLTAPWHAERSSCLRGFMLRAPRYALVNGKPQFAGACSDLWASRLRAALSITAVTSHFVEPLLGRADRAALDLYVAILLRAGELGRQKYGARTVILYLRDPAYLGHTGYTDDQIMDRLREGGLTVIDATLDQAKFPGQDLYIPGDGHPTGIANRARAAMLAEQLGDLAASGP